jgi:hypothetical protein
VWGKPEGWTPYSNKMNINNLQNTRAVQATLTGQAATAVAANTKTQRFRRKVNPTVSIDFDPLFANDDGRIASMSLPSSVRDFTCFSRHNAFR